MLNKGNTTPPAIICLLTNPLLLVFKKKNHYTVILTSNFTSFHAKFFSAKLLARELFMFSS